MSNRTTSITLLTISACMTFVATGRAQTTTAIQLTDISAQCGIDFVHSDGGTGQRTVVESVVAGLATLDFDDDGLIDIFFLNSRMLDGKSEGQYPTVSQPGQLSIR